MGRGLQNLGLESCLDDPLVDLVDAVGVDVLGVDDNGPKVGMSNMHYFDVITGAFG